MWHVRIIDTFICVCVSPFLLFSWSVSTGVEQKSAEQRKKLTRSHTHTKFLWCCEFKVRISKMHTVVLYCNAIAATLRRLQFQCIHTDGTLFFRFSVTFVWYCQCTLNAVCAKCTSVVRSTFQWATQECNDILVWCRWTNERNKMERVHKESVYT